MVRRDYQTARFAIINDSRITPEIYALEWDDKGEPAQSRTIATRLLRTLERRRPDIPVLKQAKAEYAARVARRVKLATVVILVNTNTRIWSACGLPHGTLVVSPSYFRSQEL
jgi:hypothetical protein